MTFVEILNDLLLERGKTKVDLSTEAGIPYTTICGWLKAGRLPDYNAITKLANYFQISADYILGIENEEGIKKYSYPQTQTSIDEQELLRAYRQMSEGKKRALFQMLDIDITALSKKNTN